MATYTAAQLYGTGTLGENLTSGVTYTFAFTSSGDSSYFVLETVRNSNGTFVNQPTCSDGTWGVSLVPGFVQSPYIAAAVVPPGTSSVTFVPTNNVTGTDYYLRGTGQFSLDIS